MIERTITSNVQSNNLESDSIKIPYPLITGSNISKTSIYSIVQI